MSERINTGGEFYSAIIGEKSTGDYTAVRIYEELRKKGFQGSYSLMKHYSRPMRNDRKILAVYG